MIFKFLDTTAVRAFAESIVTDYDRLRRSATLRDNSPEKLRQRQEKLVERFEQFRREHKPNFYQKAKMIQTAQEGLRTRGFSEAEISEFLNAAMTLPLRRSAQRG